MQVHRRVCAIGGLDQWVERQVFARPQGLAIDGMRQADAGVDGAVGHAVAIGLAEHHGAGAAVAFAAALLGAGVAQVLAQHLQNVRSGGTLANAIGWPRRMNCKERMVERLQRMTADVLG